MSFSHFVETSYEYDENSIAPNTKRAYESLLNSYSKYMKEIPHAPDPFPLTSEKCRGFISWYIEEHPKTTFGYVRQYISAFTYFQKKNNLEDFTKTQNFSQFLNGLRRKMKTDKPPNAKFYITKPMMIQIVQNSDVPDEIKALVTILYFGFLRISEGLNLRMRDVTFDEGGRMVLSIPFSKTDQTGRAVEIYIAPTEAPHSPFIWFWNWVKAMKLEKDEKIFKKANTTYRRQIKKALQSIGIDCSTYSTHSFRKGAAHQASIEGVQDSMIKSMGRWASSCYTTYTAISMKQAGDSLANIL